MTGHLRHPWRLIAPFALLIFLPQMLLVWPDWSPPQIAENRALATTPQPLQSLSDLDRFRRDTDAWVADRFPGRTLSITGLNVLRYRLGYSGTGRVRVGDDGWLFYDNGEHLPQLRKSTLSTQQTHAWAQEMERRHRLLQSRGVPYFVLVPPVKERVYPERLPEWLRYPSGAADVDILVAAMREAGIPILQSPIDALIAAKRRGERVYTAFDTHWTGQGAYYGYAQLLQAMGDKGLRVNTLPMEVFSEREPPPAYRDRDLAHMLGVGNLVHQRFAYLESPAVQAALSTTYLGPEGDWTSDRVVDTGQAGPTLLFTGDSFSNAMMPMLYASFSRVIFSHHQNGYFREDLIRRFSPDVVVLETLESGVRHAATTPPDHDASAPRVRNAAIPYRVDAWHPAESDFLEGRATHQCSLDSMKAKGGGMFEVSGWFADVGRRHVPESVELVLQKDDDAWSFQVSLIGERPDVADFFLVSEIRNSGFSAEIDAGSIPQGTYAVHFRSKTPGASLLCRTLTSVEIVHGVQ
jgi:alginate O-acetyltransferase complex protein AlgJ